MTVSLQLSDYKPDIVLELSQNYLYNYNYYNYINITYEISFPTSVTARVHTQMVTYQLLQCMLIFQLKQ